MTENYVHIDSESQPERESLEPSLDSYFGNLYGRMNPELSNNESFQQEIKSTSLSIINRNNKVAEILKSPFYKEVIENDKKLKGPCAVNIDICIDGRIPDIHLLGLTGNTWETAAGIIELRESPLDGTLELESSRLTEAIIERTEKENPQMLQILVSHTSLSEHRRLSEDNFKELPDHGCGKMKKMYLDGEVTNRDLIAANLEIHDKSATAFTDLYNRAAEANKVTPLKKVAMSAVYDTDTMGILLGYGTDNELFTTDITRNIVDDQTINSELTEIAGEAGSMKDEFTNVDKIIELETKVMSTTEYLMNNESFKNSFERYSNTYLQDYTEEQKNALFYTLSRNIAFQRTSGVYERQESHEHTHPFVHHGEGYQSISMDGAIVGEFDPEVQVFGAMVSSYPEAIDHIKIQTGLMESIKATEPPYIIFLSNSISNGATPEILERARGQLRVLFREIKSDPDIMNWIKTGKLVPVPVLIDSKTREIRDVAKELAI